MTCGCTLTRIRLDVGEASALTAPLVDLGAAVAMEALLCSTAGKASGGAATGTGTEAKADLLDRVEVGVISGLSLFPATGPVGLADGNRGSVLAFFSSGGSVSQFSST